MIPNLGTADLLYPHDLLWIDGEVEPDAGQTIPPWVRPSLADLPVVVVRRGFAPHGWIAVGVRGSERSLRWGGYVPAAAVRRRTRPMDLAIRRYDVCDIQRRRKLPALNVFPSIACILGKRKLRWGPTGSVGFELATGYPVVRDDSDLDLMIEAPSPISRAASRALVNDVTALEVRADVVVETPFGGFSLYEFCTSSDGRCLLKTHDGPRLVSDPWRAAKGDGT